MVRIVNLFDIKKGSRLTKEQMKPGNVRFIGSSSRDNGVTAFVGNTEKLHPSNTITVSYNGSVGEAFYQDEAFWASDDINVLYPKFELDFYIAAFVIAALRKLGSGYGYGFKWHVKRMMQDSLYLPVTEKGEVAYEFMRNYIKTLETVYRDRIKQFITPPQIKKHLSQGLQTGYELFQTELEEVLSKVPTFKKFKVSEVFSIKNSGNILLSQVEEDSGDIPYVTAKEGNNSILAYVKDIGALKEEKNTIFIGGKTLVITFQDRDYYSNDSHNLILKLKGELDADFLRLSLSRNGPCEVIILQIYLGKLLFPKPRLIQTMSSYR